MIINILYNDNGVGLTRDANLLRVILTQAGHEVAILDQLRHQRSRMADVCIHLEHVHHRMFHMGQRHVFFPNPEWYQAGWDKFLDRMAVVCAKTLDCQNIFQKKHFQTIYTGFTSEDRYTPGTHKRRAYLHVGGQSETKCTREVHDAFYRNGFGKLVITSKKYNFKTTDKIFFSNWLSQDDIRDLQNTCSIHVCPSQYEGFGHYINEARSCGAVIITTDWPPMHEFARNGNGFLVPISATRRMGIATIANITSEGLAQVIRVVESTGDAKLKQMGEASRQAYLDDDKAFKERFLHIIKHL
jgi:glycosyltransferase involved in cell wall biosynthesis